MNEFKPLQKIMFVFDNNGISKLLSNKIPVDQIGREIEIYSDFYKNPFTFLRHTGRWVFGIPADEYMELSNNIENKQLKINYFDSLIHLKTEGNKIRRSIYNGWDDNKVDLFVVADNEITIKSKVGLNQMQRLDTLNLMFYKQGYEKIGGEIDIYNELIYSTAHFVKKYGLKKDIIF